MKGVEVLLFTIAVLISVLIVVEVQTAINTQRVADVFYGNSVEIKY